MEGHEQQQGDIYDGDLYDGPGEVTPEQLAAVEQQLSAINSRDFEANAAALVEEFPEIVASEDSAQEFVGAAQERAEALGTPGIWNDLRFTRALAAERRMDAQAERQAYERSDQARIDRIFKRGGSRVLPWG